MFLTGSGVRGQGSEGVRLDRQMMAYGTFSGFPLVLTIFVTVI